MYIKKNFDYSRSGLNGISNGEAFDIEAEIIVTAAEEHGISWRVVPDSDTIELTRGEETHYFRKSIPETTTFIAAMICENKSWTRALLKDKNVPVVPGYFIKHSDSDEYITDIFHKLQKPLVVKITHGSHGDGVVVNISDFEVYKKTVTDLLAISTNLHNGVLVEEMFSGKEYRVLCTREKVIGIMHRAPANITGDGVKTVKELIELKNTDPMRNITHELYPHISLDEDMIKILAQQNLTPDSVIEDKKTIQLRIVSNIMAGGDAVDYTDIAHESVKEAALATINAIPGLSFAGVDFMTKDITRLQDNSMYTIIEVNSAPEFAMHDIPMIGKPREAALEFLKLLFPNLEK